MPVQLPGNPMDERLFRRVARVTLISPNGSYFPAGQNGLEITDMRMKFQIERSVKADPNACMLEIYNLSETTRKFCENRPLTVWIDAGYDNNPKQLFTGDSHFAFSRMEKPEWVTKIQLRDGGQAYDNARINMTYGSGVPVSKVLNDFASKFGLRVDPAQAKALAPLLSQTLPGARVYQGPVRDQLTQLLSPVGVQWSIQNSTLQLLRDVDTTGFTFVISQETGMIGSPEWTSPKSDTKPNQLKIKSLLQPEIGPGTAIIVRSADINGVTFRVQKIVHRGDTHGDEWISEIEALPPGAVADSDPIRWNANAPGGHGAPTGAGSE